MRIQIMGAHGMLGAEVSKAAHAAGIEHSIHGHYSVDITNASHVKSALKSYKPEVVINCAGLTKHRTPEPTAAEYRAVNTDGPHILAAECDRIGARLIHVSTDCVFSGTRPLADGPYTEDDEPDATDPYGQSKADGEVTRAPHLTVRCSFVGLGERGLIAWLRGRRYVDLWMGAQWSGSTAPAIARALVELAQRPDVTGLMHLTRGERITKADLITAICSAGLAGEGAIGFQHVGLPEINRWLASTRPDVPALPPLHEALRELADG